MIDITDEEKAILDETIADSIENLTHQYTDDEIIDAINCIWKMAFDKNPKVTVCDSVVACRDKAIESGEEDLVEFWSHWGLSYAGIYEFALKIGTEVVDKEKAEAFINWVRRASFIIMNEDTVFVSKNPKELYHEDSALSNDSGPAIKFNDGISIWSINGVSVDEQIVMNPETLTIDQINNEPNEEIRRIMIDRYGSSKYLEGMGATITDGPIDNWIEGTKEYLFHTSRDEAYLLCVCPSTGKDFYLQVDPSVRTCQEAQAMLSNGLSSRIISAS